jgi:fatty acid desaturase
MRHIICRFDRFEPVRTAAVDGSENHQVTTPPAAFVDWPTVGLIATFWSALVLVVLFGGDLPAILVMAALATLGGLHMSLQHEVIHGHPTRSRSFNRLLVGLPLGLILPFGRYRAIHLAHHGCDLTDPRSDPESFYVLPSTWEQAGPVRRLTLRANRTLAARLTIGPVLATGRIISDDFRHASKDWSIARAWGLHLIGSAVVVTAVVLSGLPLWMYLVGFVYGGASFTSLRSFVEHRASENEPRSAVVHSNWFFSVLFLNNNLHYTHHQLPGAAWFRLPELTEALDADHAVEHGAGSYAGYGAIARRYLFRPFDQPVHPIGAEMEV